LCRRVAILEAGRLLAFGPPAGLAAGMWTGLPVDLDMGGAADESKVERLRNVRGVTAVQPSPSGARVVVEDREVIPGVLAVAMPVFSVVPRPPGLEEVYFALTGRAEPSEDGLAPQPVSTAVGG
jgi:ABC-type multidrug transport system ATPase subunit